jgi:hypothetical protein
MTSAKYRELARVYLESEIDGLAAWLEGNVKRIREEQGPNEVVMVSRNSHLEPNDEGLHYNFASIQFEIANGDEIL